MRNSRSARKGDTLEFFASVCVRRNFTQYSSTNGENIFWKGQRGVSGERCKEAEFASAEFENFMRENGAFILVLVVNSMLLCATLYFMTIILFLSLSLSFSLFLFLSLQSY
jgi:hypothetical protein